MPITKTCPNCGSSEIAWGQLTPNIRLFEMPNEKNESSANSTIMVEVCTTCGLVLRPFAKNPAIFKPKK